MTDTATLPAQLPTLPDKVEGIVCLDPFTIQCRGCGTTDTEHTVRAPKGKPHLTVMFSRIRFHPTTWTTGDTDNPRLCAPCRLGRGCQCHACRDERRGA